MAGKTPMKPGRLVRRGAMVEVLLEAFAKAAALEPGDLSPPPIRDWVWWKNKEACLRR